MLPDRFKKLYSQSEIATSLARLGSEITPWAESTFQSTGRDVIGIPILRGGLFFYADLVRAIGHSVEVAPVRTWSYDTETKSINKNMEMHLDDIDPVGRAILLVDDICDSGRTMALLSEEFKQRGASEVKTAVLVRRDLQGTFVPDYIGFQFNGPEWLVGYGMEDNDRYRNLPDVYTIEGTGN
jgi:hypoxanthine phosphoribosyltransferase